jgi:hypothetical protein
MSGKWRLPRGEGAQANHGPRSTSAAHRQRPPKQLPRTAGICNTIRSIVRQPLMSSPLLDVWEAASGSPYYPAVGKNTQLTVGFVLLFLCMFPQW